jgi:L-amino acid N-acyltransferase YncA
VTELLDAMVQARLPWISGEVRSWYDDARLVELLRSDLGPQAAMVGDASFGAEFRTSVGLGIGEAADWANRRVELPGNGWVVCGIRYRGRAVDRPFVDVVATTEPPTPDGLAAVAEVVVPLYADFDPLCLRVDAPDPQPLVAALDADPRFGVSGIDMHVVAAPVRELRARERVPAYDVLTLRPGEPHAMARRVAAIYADLDTRNPALALWARPEGEATMRACADQGLLFEVVVDGHPAGVVAAIREDAHGMSGFCVQEIVLDAAHQGRRLAPAVLQRLVDALPAKDDDVLWGTIHPGNTPSLRNSMSIGRRLVGGYVWVTPAALPGMP